MRTLTTNIIAIVSVIFLLWISWIIIKKVFGISTWTGKGIAGAGAWLAKKGARNITDSIKHKRRINRRLKLEDEHRSSIDKEKDNIKTAEEVIKDKNSSAKIKANALNSFFDAQRALLEPQKDGYKEHLKELDDAKDDEKDILNRTKSLLRNERKLQERTLDESREIKKLLGDEGDDSAAQQIVAAVEELKPLEEQLTAIENQDRNTLIPQLKDNSKRRLELVGESLDLISQAEKIPKEGILGPSQLEELLNLVGQLRVKTTELDNLSNTAKSLEEQRSKLSDRATAIEVNINDHIEKMKPLITQHDLAFKNAKEKAKVNPKD